MRKSRPGEGHKDWSQHPEEELAPEAENRTLSARAQAHSGGSMLLAKKLDRARAHDQQAGVCHQANNRLTQGGKADTRAAVPKK